MRIYFLHLLFFFTSLIVNVHGQGQLDSLINQYSNTQEDTSRLRLLIELSIKGSTINMDTSLVYSTKAAQLAEEIGNNKWLSEAYMRQSFALISMGNADDAVPIIEEALRIFRISGDSLSIAKGLERYGVALENTGQYEEAREAYFEALNISERNNFIDPQIETLNSLAIYCMGQRDMPQSILFLEDCLNIAEENNRINKVVRACINLSVAHDSIEIKKTYLNKAIELAEPLNLQRELAYAYGAKAGVYQMEEDWENAVLWQRKKSEILLEKGDITGSRRSDRSLGIYLMELRRYQEAENVFRSLLKDPAISGKKTMKYFNLEYLSQTLAAQGKYKEAYDTLKSGYYASREVYEQNMEDNAADALTRYETLQKEEEIAKQKLEIEQKKAQRNEIAGIGGILLLLSSGAGVWYYQKQSNKKKIAELALIQERSEKERLEELDELKTQFFTNVSHELKTPLTLILGPLANIIEQSDDEQIKSDLILAYNNAERLEQLINETLQLAKIESGNARITQVPTLINQSAKNTLYSFHSLAEMKNIRLRFSSDILDDNVLSIDYNKVEKIINNLISNAIKFSPNNALVQLNLRYDSEKLIMRVEDQGPGIPESEHSKIFNRFYQSVHNRKGNYGGTGVGLSYAKELAEVMEGNLTVHINDGGGSTFILTVPSKTTNAVVVDNEISTNSETVAINYTPLLIDGEKPNILIVEDHPDMQTYIHKLLQEDYHCEFASDGMEAIRLIQKNKYDLISSDIMMPNMDGFTLKRRINEVIKDVQIPFIFLSARSSDDDLMEGLQLGVDDYIKKPFKKEEYRARVYNLIKNSQNRLNFHLDETPNSLTESADTTTLKKIEKSILNNLSNPDYKVNDLAETIHYSQRQLGRITKQLTGLTPVELILELRLQKAYRMIQRHAHTSISEVRYEVGIESASYFARKFKQRFGVSPSEVK